MPKVFKKFPSIQTINITLDTNFKDVRGNVSKGRAISATFTRDNAASIHWDKINHDDVPGLLMISGSIQSCDFVKYGTEPCLSCHRRTSAPKSSASRLAFGRWDETAIAPFEGRLRKLLEADFDRVGITRRRRPQCRSP
jgi:hypothetical protein